MKKVNRKVYARRIKACAASPKLSPKQSLEQFIAGLPDNLAALKWEGDDVGGLKSRDWPGCASNRTVIAALDCAEKDVARAFKENPGSLWVITPYAVIERAKFFAPAPAPVPGQQP